MTPLPDLVREVALLDEILHPIANRPVDINDPDWRTQLARSDPMTEAGIKTEAQAALRALIRHYAEGDDETRESVRAVFDRYPAFGGMVHIPLDPTPAGFRFRLLHFSAMDQGSDTRDELLELWELVARAEAEGVDIEPILTEVAELSSDVDKYGMGSTRRLLLEDSGV